VSLSHRWHKLTRTALGGQLRVPNSVGQGGFYILLQDDHSEPGGVADKPCTQKHRITLPDSWVYEDKDILVFKYTSMWIRKKYLWHRASMTPQLGVKSKVEGTPPLPPRKQC
jgi:hypothetical protein